ncbi:conserved hypothetical protein [Methanocella paludicola SANAE]|uniref:Archaeal Type IV pilin N-terminal domain-containing protein n=1 Tax=Methanocella paludicola (strain DSM 17711 / JCM 13418 / NBRC 101707 / SANAE) TaxID=304371 RepID=D1YV64_METPS|nr:hypothetical protein [Methanocella paludicola]BAI60336.1 conserved hypothetical protein [Methanocella paludicola SANAE]
MREIIYSDEAVSESLGFVLIACIITFAISLVIMLGYPVYVNSINEAHMQNMEEGFYLLSTNGNMVAMYQSPAQSSELKLDNGALYTRIDGEISVICKDSANNVINPFDTPYPLTSLEYQLGNMRIAYDLGGVFKKDGSSSIVLKEPPIYYKTALVVPVITIQNSIGSISGKGLTRITLNSPYSSKISSTVSYQNAKIYTHVKSVQINIKCDYNDALQRYFKDSQGSLQFDSAIIDSNGVLIATKTYPTDITVYITPSYVNVKVN